MLQIQTLDNRMEGADENKERLFHSKLFFETKCVKFRSETDSQESLRSILFLKVEIGDTKDAHFENTSQCIIFHLSLSLSSSSSLSHFQSFSLWFSLIFYLLLSFFYFVWTSHHWAEVAAAVWNTFRSKDFTYFYGSCTSLKTNITWPLAFIN